MTRQHLVFYCLFFLFLAYPKVFAQRTIYVSPEGKDIWAGTLTKPVATFSKAQELARKITKGNDSVNVIFADGIYYLQNTINFTKEDNSDTLCKINYQAENEGKAIISGGLLLNLKWEKKDNGIYIAKIPQGTIIDQLYINGIRQRMARYPNASTDSKRNVYDTWVLSHQAIEDTENDVLNPERVKTWQNPVNGYLHSMHSALWGDMHWLIKGKNQDGSLVLEGGWQNNRPSRMHVLYRMIENIKEELDAPGEWFLENQTNTLYYYPEENTNLDNAKIEIVRLKHLIEFNGTEEAPVKGINLKGFVFKHASRTFMENKEPLLRSDWTVYRGGAIVYNGAENCLIENCEFDQLGGNTVFVNNYNKNIVIRGCYIHDSGASGIVFVGDPQSVRSPLYRYGKQDYENIDRIPGPKTNNYPQNCLVEDCLITMTGRDEKQTAPIQISMSYKIHISHCSIYDVPRAGININEGTFGGHIIEYCDVFNTVLETGDHGSFNSWGRDRFWDPDVKIISDQVSRNPGMQYWDILAPVIIRNNRWRCDHGWDIDLDDGSSYYRIYNNLMLNGGLKLREGFDRVVTNNITINNTLHPHVWPQGSGDIFKNNIVFGPYRPALMDKALDVNDKWGAEIDHNFFVSDEESLKRFQKNDADKNSLYGDALFINPDNGDYNVSEDSPALKVGFRNFEMNNFGVKSEKLRAISKTPLIPELKVELVKGENSRAKSQALFWLGSSIKEPREDELSAYGVRFNNSGIAFGIIKTNSEAAKIGFQSGDLIQSINNYPIKKIHDLKDYLQNELKENTPQIFVIIRNQNKIVLKTSSINNRHVTEE